MCVESSLCQLWQDLHRRNWKEIWSQITGTHAGLKWNPKQDAHSLEAFVQQVEQNTTNPLSPTTQPKRTMLSTSLERRWSTESQSVLPDGSKRPYTPERKNNRPWTVMRAATNWATRTIAFLTRRLPLVSWTKRTEYQLLLMKASDRGRLDVKL